MLSAKAEGLRILFRGLLETEKQGEIPSKTEIQDKSHH